MEHICLTTVSLLKELKKLNFAKGKNMKDIPMFWFSKGKIMKDKIAKVKFYLDFDFQIYYP